MIEFLTADPAERAMFCAIVFFTFAGVTKPHKLVIIKIRIVTEFGLGHLLELNGLCYLSIEVADVGENGPRDVVSF